MNNKLALHRWHGIVHSVYQNARRLPERIIDTAGILDNEYTYDASGNVTSMIDRYDDNRSRWMTYDGLDRLTAAGSAIFGGSDHYHRFSYDTLDNIRTWTHAGIKDHRYYYDTSNRLTNMQNPEGATVIGLAYDVQGNLSNRNGQAHEFDYGNRLREVTGKESYRYDGHGRRALAWSPGGNILSMYSQAGQLVYAVEDANRGGKSKEHIYLGGSLVAIRETPLGSGSAAVKYQHTDALGSPVAVTDEVAQTLDRTNYEPYGAAIGKTVQGVGYTGHVMDAATGLTYMQQRYMDPGLGVFLSVDPVTALSNPVGQFNRYRYANNNPYRFTDPDGRLACSGGNFDCLRQRQKLERRGIPAWEAGGSSANTKPQAKTGDDVKTLAKVAVVGQRVAPIVGGGSRVGPWGAGIGRMVGGMLNFARGPFLFLYAPHPCSGQRCGELPGAFSKVSDVPSVGPPGEWVDGRRRSRLYGPDGRPKVDIDNPHQGAPYPHVHDWDENGVREHPGREVPDLPPPESDGGGG